VTTTHAGTATSRWYLGHFPIPETEFRTADGERKRSQIDKHACERGYDDILARGIDQTTHNLKQDKPTGQRSGIEAELRL
jgi:hypothetical protein